MGLCVLCSTRWTVLCPVFLKITQFNESLGRSKSCCETTGWINGVLSYMENFFGVMLGKLILGHFDNLSKSLKVENSYSKQAPKSQLKH